MGVRIMIVALLLVGCGGLPTPEVSAPLVTCADPTSFTPPSPLSCSAGIAAARRALGAFPAPIVAVSFAYGPVPCPPNARCALVERDPTEGHVIFRFVVGPPMVVAVSVDVSTGIVSAVEAQPLPTGL